MAWFLNNRQHWPVMAFTAGLLAFAAIVIVSSSAGGWCGPGESGPVCFRNWLGAIGSAGTTLVAIAAFLLVWPRLRSGLDVAAAAIVTTPAASPPGAAGALHRLVEVGQDAREQVDELAAAVERLAGTSPDGSAAADLVSLRRGWQGRDHAIESATEAARAAADATSRRAASRLKRLGDDVAAALAPLGSSIDETGRASASGLEASSAQRQRLLYLKTTLDELAPKFAAFVAEYTPPSTGEEARRERRVGT